VDLAVRSVLAQSRPPQRVVLWLHESLRASIPDRLAACTGAGLELRFVAGTSSHRKLVHALGEFRETVIVTCDDDVMYDSEWLVRLWEDHEAHPHDVIAHEGRGIVTAPDGAVLPYTQWQWETRPGVAYPAFLPVGYGGTLYPPGALDSEVTDAAAYLALAPTADDLWFKMMSLRRGSMSRRSSRPVPKPIPVIGAKGSALARTNILEDKNRVQWDALCTRYGIASPTR
jgi:hypothetical protein